MNDIFRTRRNSSLEIGKVYFWTNTIKDWKHLLMQDKYKQLIIDTWKELVSDELVAIYGFVIMPNHIHILWELLKLNGKEMPHASFNKKVAHLIVKDLKTNHQKVLPYFQVSATERKHRIWQRDPLAVLVDSKSIIEQKLDYIHFNPLQEKWDLSRSPEDYPWSSASFYESGGSDFGFLTHYHDRF